MSPKHERYHYATRRKLGAPWQNRTAVTWLQNRRNTIILIGQIGSPAWDRTTDTLINSQVQLPLCYWGIKMAPRRGIEPLSSDGQSDIITVILTRHNGGCSLSWTNRAFRAEDLQSPGVTNFPIHPLFFGRGTENRTLILRLKAWYFSR